MGKIILEFDDDDPSDREKIHKAVGYYKLWSVIDTLDNRMRDADKYGIGKQSYSCDEIRDLLREII